LFPTGTVIEAADYLLVLCDDLVFSNTTPAYLHATFNLSENGEYVGLFNASSQVVSQIAPDYPNQYYFYSFGLDATGTNYVYLDAPTPGGLNMASGFIDRVKSVQFSTNGGIYSNAITLILTSSTIGATIRYTTNGTVPTIDNSMVYTGPLNLGYIDSNHGHAIRAVAFRPGYIPSRVRTHTYLIDMPALLEGCPAFIYTGDPEQAFFKPHGILAIEGGTYVNSQWEADGPDDYNITMNRDIWHERPFNLVCYYADGTPGLNEEGGIRAAASGFSRPRMMFPNVDASPWPANNRQKPSFNIYFRDDYGKDEIEFPWLGENYVTKFEQLRPRAGKNSIRNPFIEDEIMRRLYSDMGQESSLGTLNTLYINGELKGFYNVCERLREPFMREHHDSNLDWDIRQVNDYAQGDRDAWDEMMNRLNQDMNVLSNYQDAVELFDPINAADYFLVNIYGATWDWPQNNWVGARERSPEGRYRFYVWDAEGAFRHSNKDETHDTVGSDLLGLNNALSDFFKRIHASPEWRLLFADRVHKHLFHGGVLDDRTGAASHYGRLKDDLAAKFQPLLTFMNSETVNQGNLNAWMDPANGRRTYLFGPNEEQLRIHGLWPETKREPERRS
ncbi:MAG: FN3 associated domain-containing protein, partial [Verrucomicrobiota bacterium]